MPEYVGLKCCQPDCAIFQVTQKRKDNKWQCKICQTKQSVQKVYAISNKPSDIRPVVQKYNMEKGLAEEKAPKRIREEIVQEEEDDIEIGDDGRIIQKNPSVQNNSQPKQSKWLQFLDPKELEQEQEQNESEDDERYVTILPDVVRGRGRGRGRGLNTLDFNEKPKGRGRGRGRAKNQMEDDVIDESQYFKYENEQKAPKKAKITTKKVEAKVFHDDSDEDASIFSVGAKKPPTTYQKTSQTSFQTKQTNQKAIPVAPKSSNLFQKFQANNVVQTSTTKVQQPQVPQKTLPQKSFTSNPMTKVASKPVSAWNQLVVEQEDDDDSEDDFTTANNSYQVVEEEYL